MQIAPQSKEHLKIQAKQLVEDAVANYSNKVRDLASPATKIESISPRVWKIIIDAETEPKAIYIKFCSPRITNGKVGEVGVAVSLNDFDETNAGVSIRDLICSLALRDSNSDLVTLLNRKELKNIVGTALDLAKVSRVEGMAGEGEPLIPLRIPLAYDHIVTLTSGNEVLFKDEIAVGVRFNSSQLDSQGKKLVSPIIKSPRLASLLLNIDSENKDEISVNLTAYDGEHWDFEVSHPESLYVIFKELKTSSARLNSSDLDAADKLIEAIERRLLTLNNLDLIESEVSLKDNLLLTLHATKDDKLLSGLDSLEKLYGSMVTLHVLSADESQLKFALMQDEIKLYNKTLPPRQIGHEVCVPISSSVEDRNELLLREVNRIKESELDGLIYCEKDGSYTNFNLDRREIDLLKHARKQGYSFVASDDQNVSIYYQGLPLANGGSFNLEEANNSNELSKRLTSLIQEPPFLFACGNKRSNFLFATVSDREAGTIYDNVISEARQMGFSVELKSALVKKDKIEYELTTVYRDPQGIIPHANLGTKKFTIDKPQNILAAGYSLGQNVKKECLDLIKNPPFIIPAYNGAIPEVIKADSLLYRPLMDLRLKGINVVIVGQSEDKNKLDIQIAVRANIYEGTEFKKCRFVLKNDLTLPKDSLLADSRLQSLISSLSELELRANSSEGVLTSLNNISNEFQFVAVPFELSKQYHQHATSLDFDSVNKPSNDLNRKSIRAILPSVIETLSMIDQALPSLMPALRSKGLEREFKVALYEDIRESRIRLKDRAMFYPGKVVYSFLGPEMKSNSIEELGKRFNLTIARISHLADDKANFLEDLVNAADNNTTLTGEPQEYYIYVYTHGGKGGIQSYRGSISFQEIADALLHGPKSGRDIGSNKISLGHITLHLDSCFQGNNSTNILSFLYEKAEESGLEIVTPPIVITSAQRDKYAYSRRGHEVSLFMENMIDKTKDMKAVSYGDLMKIETSVKEEDPRITNPEIIEVNKYVEKLLKKINHPELSQPSEQKILPTPISMLKLPSVPAMLSLETRGS